MIPEISRRCLACGAAVRAGARFCQQCGGLIGKGDGGALRNEAEGIEQSGVHGGDVEAEAAPNVELLTEHWQHWEESVRVPVEEENLSGNLQSSGEASAERETPSSAVNVEQRSEQAASTVALKTTRENTTPNVNETGADSNEPETGARRRPATRVQENLRPRVEKMREASIVVMEDAPEDSGLRFLLIAVALFLLFILFLFISSFLK